MPENAVRPGTQTPGRSLRLPLSLFLALGAAIGVSFAAQSTAQAASASAHGTTASSAAVPMSSTADCPSGDLCWWVDANQIGAMHPVRDAIYDWRTQFEPTCGSGTWDDCASTLYNNKGGWGAQVYSEPYAKGGSPSSSDPGYCLEPFSKVALDLTKVHYSNEVTLSLNDTISSNRWRSGGC
jgi:hypothetical protein